MSNSHLQHADIVTALTLLEARHRNEAPDAAGGTTSRLIVELREKFGLSAGSINQPVSDVNEGSGQSSDWEDSDVDNGLDELDLDWTESLRRDAVPREGDQVELARQIEAGVIAEAALTGNWHSPQLWKASELQVLVEHGTVAFQQMLSGNYRLVLYWARRYARDDPDLMKDLFQEGFFGLVRAIQGWDYLRGYRFSTYATWQIRQAMQRGIQLRHSTAPVHIPVHLLDEINSPNVSREHLSPNATLALSWLERCIPWERLEEEASELTTRLEPDFESSIVSRLAVKISTRQILTFLDERGALVLALRSGLGGDEPATLDAVGKILNVSRERVRQIEARAVLAVRLRALSQSQALRAKVAKKLWLGPVGERNQALQCLRHELFSTSKIAAGLNVSKNRALQIADRLASAVPQCELDLTDLPCV